MRKAYILLILGIWVTVLPYLGFPYSLKDVLLTLTGIGLVGLSYMFYKEFRARQNRKETFDNFSENKFEDTEKH